MGVYLAVNSHGRPLLHLNKAQQLELDGGVVLDSPPSEWSPDLVCVVQNGAFDAAGWAYSKDEMSQFLWTGDGRDNRPRVWLKYPHIKIAISSPQTYEMMRKEYPNG